MTMTPGDVRQFEDAFDMHISGPVAECYCGKVFWDCGNTGYDWSDGERERLESNREAVPLRHGVQRIELEGIVYCMDCTCWHSRAERITEWMRDHSRQIGEWFRLEKARLEKAASNVPVIEDTKS